MGFNDSKALDERQRDALFRRMKQTPGLGWWVLCASSKGVFWDGVLAVQAHRRQNNSTARQCSTEETHLGALIATIKPAEEQSVSPMVIMVHVHARIIHSIPATELSAKMLRKEPMSLNVISHDAGK